MQRKHEELDGTNNADSALLKGCHQNFLAAFREISSLMPQGAVERCEGFTVIRTAMPAPLFNPVIALDPIEKFEGLAERIDRMFGPDRIPWSLVTTPASFAVLGQLISELKLKQAGSMPAMIYDLGGATTPPWAGDLDIRQVTEPGELRAWARTCEKGTGLLEGVLAPLAEGIIADPGVLRRMALYLGYVGGHPVSTSMRISTGQVAGVYCVATLADGRGHGYGTALTWRAGFEGLEEGCKIAYLNASDMGRPVYERMGYKEVEEYQIWVPLSPANNEFESSA